MNSESPFSHLKFETPRFRLLPRWMVMIASLVIYSILWAILPTGIIFGVSLIVITILIWISSFGWRQAVSMLIDLLSRLEQY